jgi:hypothetical protein
VCSGRAITIASEFAKRIDQHPQTPVAVRTAYGDSSVLVKRYFVGFFDENGKLQAASALGALSDEEALKEAVAQFADSAFHSVEVRRNEQPIYRAVRGATGVEPSISVSF